MSDVQPEQYFNAYNFPYWYFIEQPEGEYGPEDPEYDWGFAEDGTPNPLPCPWCGTPYYACTSPHYDPSILE